MIVAVVLVVAATSSCDQKENTGSSTRPGWITRSEPPSPVAVVFIHGIFGDAVGTWTHPNKTTFFDLLEQSDIGAKVDVYAFGFMSEMFEGGSASIDEAARSLHEYLRHHNVWTYERIVFVGHSMGGLVAMQELTSHPQLARKVPLLIMYATPQEGSEITAIAKHVVDNDAIRQMLLAENNAFLQELNNEWTELKRQGQAPMVVCAYEKRPTQGVLIVRWSSATRVCDEAPPAIPGSDHISIVKPAHKDELAVVVLLNAMRRYVLPQLDASSWRVEGAEQAEGEWVYWLRDVTNFGVLRIANLSGVRQSYRIIRNPASGLYIAPEDEVRTVAAGGFDELRMLPVGPLASEYFFELKLGGAPPQKLHVRIENFAEAASSRARRAGQLAAVLNDFVEDEKGISALASLSEAEQHTQLRDVAFRFTAKTLPEADSKTQWISTADALSRVGLNDAAALALKEVDAMSPPTDGSLNGDLRKLIIGQPAFSEQAELIRMPRPRRSQGGLNEAPEYRFAGSSQQREWRRLERNMSSVSELRHRTFDLQPYTGEAAATAPTADAGSEEPVPEY